MVKEASAGPPLPGLSQPPFYSLPPKNASLTTVPTPLAASLVSTGRQKSRVAQAAVLPGATHFLDSFIASLQHPEWAAVLALKLGCKCHPIPNIRIHYSLACCPPFHWPLPDLVISCEGLLHPLPELAVFEKGEKGVDEVASGVEDSHGLKQRFGKGLAFIITLRF